MDRHLLVTISNDPQHLHGIRYVAYFFQDKRDIRLTLFNVVAGAPAVWAEEKSFETLAQGEEMAKRNLDRSLQTLSECKRILVQHGFLPDNIDTKHSSQGMSRAMTILREGEEGLYDAVVLGRRATMRLAEILDDSVSKGLLMEEVTFPLWICREPEWGRRNVLLCADGSEPSLRMADHVGFMLAKETEHNVTMLHVTRPGGSDDPAPIFAATREAMERNGVAPERIEARVLEAAKVAPAILREASDRRYAAVAVGRTGAGEGLLGRLFMGSVSMSLFREIREAALWTCR